MSEQDVLEIPAPKVNYWDVFNTLPHWLIGLLVYEKGTYLAGGACRSAYDNTLVQDYDLFFKDKETKDRVEKRLGGEERVVFRCPEDKLITIRNYGVKIQLCSPRYYPTPESLIESFDIKASGIALYSGKDNWELHVLPDALSDAVNKRIRLNNLIYPIATINRIQKYRAKGYSITDEVWKDLLTKVRQLSEEDFNDPDKMALYID